MDNFLVALKQEYSKICLEYQELTRKKEAAGRLIALYEREMAGPDLLTPSLIPPAPAPVVLPPLPPLPVVESKPPFPPPPRQVYEVTNAVPLPMTMKQQITEFAAKALANGRFASTLVLITEMEAAGIRITGYDKRQTVSSLLSKDGRFTPDRLRGWSLKKRSPGKVPAFPGPPVAPAM